MTAREREDGFWSFAIWLETPAVDWDQADRLDHAFKAKILQFEGLEWTMLAVVQEAHRYVMHVAELAGAEQPDALDLWGNV